MTTTCPPLICGLPPAHGPPLIWRLPCSANPHEKSQNHVPKTLIGHFIHRQSEEPSFTIVDIYCQHQLPEATPKPGFGAVQPSPITRICTPSGNPRFGPIPDSASPRGAHDASRGFSTFDFNGSPFRSDETPADTAMRTPASTESTGGCSCPTPKPNSTQDGPALPTPHADCRAHNRCFRHGHFKSFSSGFFRAILAAGCCFRSHHCISQLHSRKSLTSPMEAALVS